MSNQYQLYSKKNAITVDDIDTKITQYPTDAASVIEITNVQQSIGFINSSILDWWTRSFNLHHSIHGCGVILKV